MNRVIFSAALLASLAAADAQAASWLVCDGSHKIKWGGNSTTARINTVSYPAGPILQTAQRGIDIVNTNPSNFNINRTTETGGVGRGNGQNEVYALDIDPPGVARMNYHCYWFFGIHAGLDEVDIVLDSGITNWTTTRNKSSHGVYGGGSTPIEPVIVHEAGHYLGLMHVDWEYNVMGDAWRHLHANGSETRSYFGEDAGHGARQLYGTQGSSFTDVSVSHWRYIGSDGEYSMHDRTRMFNSAGTSELGKSTVNGEPRYNVTRGGTVRAEFTIENNGKATVNNVGYGLYISTNDTISTSDRRVGGGSFGSINPADVSTQQFSLTIPNDLAAATNYWVGFIIDENNTITEVDGWNNKAYIGIRTN